MSILSRSGVPRTVRTPPPTLAVAGTSRDSSGSTCRRMTSPLRGQGRTFLLIGKVAAGLQEKLEVGQIHSSIRVKSSLDTSRESLKVPATFQPMRGRGDHPARGEPCAWRGRGAGLSGYWRSP